MSAYGSLAPVYDLLTRDVDYSKFADFYEKIFAEYNIKPESILDLACGTGTLTQELVSRGYDMTAADASEDMLSVAMEKTIMLDAKKRPLFLCQSMQELDLYGTVSAAVCSLDGINYVPPEDLDEVFSRLRLFVEPGGVFVFDINTEKRLVNQDGQVFIDETDDILCVWRAEVNREEQTCTYGMDIFVKEGKFWERYREEHVEHIHTVGFLKELLGQNGFEDIRVYGELKLAAPEEGEERVFISARRTLDQEE